MSEFDPLFGTGKSFKKSSEIDPQSEESMATVKRMKKLFEAARSARKPKDPRWNEQLEFYLGKQWQAKRPSFRSSEVFNLVFSLVEGMVPIIKDARPRIGFSPVEPQDLELANVLDDLVEFDWGEGNWQDPMTDTLRDSLILGTGLGAMEFDPGVNSGAGKIEMRSVDPFTFYPAPRATNINKGEPYVIESTPVDLEFAQSLFPEIAPLMKPGVQSGNKVLEDRKKFLTTDEANSVDLDKAYDDIASDYTGKELAETDQVLMNRYFMNDATMEEVELTSNKDSKARDDFKEAEKYKLKYPKGRYIVTVNDVLAFDGHNPYADGKFPYARLVNYPIPRNFWGISDVQWLMGPQRLTNRVVNFLIESLMLMSNPIWVVDQGAVDPDLITNQAGLIVEKLKGSDVHRESGAGVPPQMFELLRVAQELFNRIHGMGETSQGIRPEGISSGDQLELLVQVSQTRLREKARNLETFLDDMGKLYVARAMQFYREPRIIAITGRDSGIRPKFFKFRIQEAEDGNGYEALIHDFNPVNPNDPKSALVVSDQPRVFKTKGIFDVRSSVSSNLPFAKRSQAATAIQLFDSQVIDKEDLLDKLEWPDREKILLRVKTLELQNQAQNAQQQQPS